MTWEEFLKYKVETIDKGLRETSIDCPECGKKLYINTNIVLSCYPPKYRYTCLNCKWEGMA